MVSGEGLPGPDSLSLLKLIVARRNCAGKRLVSMWLFNNVAGDEWLFSRLVSFSRQIRTRFTVAVVSGQGSGSAPKYTTY